MCDCAKYLVVWYNAPRCSLSSQCIEILSTWIKGIFSFKHDRFSYLKNSKVTLKQSVGECNSKAIKNHEILTEVNLDMTRNRVL